MVGASLLLGTLPASAGAWASRAKPEGFAAPIKKLRIQYKETLPMEPTEARELIEEAIEAGESHERVFRNRVSVMVGLFALALAVIHTVGAGAQRESLLASIEASDTFNYMQAKTIREAVFRTASSTPGIDSDTRAADLGEVTRLRQDDASGHGIEQLRKAGLALRQESMAKANAAEGYELGETALQVAIVLLSIALVAQSRRLVTGAMGVAGLGVAVAVLTALRSVLM